MHPNELRLQAEDELEKEKRELEQLLMGEFLAHHNTLFIIGCLLANIVLASLFPNYMVAWIAASFFLYVLGPLVMLIPAERGKDFLPSKSSLERYIDIIREHGNAQDARTLGQVIWNVFFINSQALAIGYCTIFAIDILFSTISGFFTGRLPQGTAMQVILQSIAIIVFFGAIWKYRPYTPQFIGSLHQIQDRLQRRMQETWKIFLALGGISAGVSLLVVVAMLLPGFVLGEVVKAPDAVNAITALPITIIFISQLGVLRYLQGVYSKELALRFMNGKIHSLETIVRELNSLEATEEPVARDRERAEGNQGINELWRLYVRTKVYRTARHSLFGYLPVYMVVPDLSLVVGEESPLVDDWYVPMGG